MLKSYVIIFISFLFLFNSMAIEIVAIFIPNKTEIVKTLNQNSETQELEYACQFHDCGCTKESCKISCCCKINHEAFDEVKENKKLIEKGKSLSTPENAVSTKTKSINLIQLLICKKDKIKEYGITLSKKEPYVYIKQKVGVRTLIIPSRQPSDPIVYLGLSPQIFYIPDSPPPKNPNV